MKMTVCGAMRTMVLSLVLAVGLASAAVAQKGPLPVPTPRPDDGPQAVSPAPSPPAEAPPAAEGEPVGQTPAAASAETAASAPVRRISCSAVLEGRVSGKVVESIREGQCGEDSPLRISALGSVRLVHEAVTNCAMTEALAQFALKAGELARETLGAELVAIDAGPGYQCRRRNRATAGKMSEHAFANALDVVSFQLSDGRKIAVEADWPHLDALPAEGEKPAPPAGRAATPQARYLAGLHAIACKQFTTVLGPDANAAHRSHFHFDLGCHGKTCTYLICE